LGGGDALDGSGYRPAGLPALREAVAAHLTGRGLETSATEVLITTGAQQAVSLLARVLLRQGDLVVVEEFTNPVGALMPPAARRRLAGLAANHNVPVVDDAVVADLGLGAPVPPPVAFYRPDAPVVLVGSLSKLFWGGLRIGWLRAPKPMISFLARAKAVEDLGTSVLAQVLAVRLLERGRRGHRLAQPRAAPPARPCRGGAERGRHLLGVGAAGRRPEPVGAHAWRRRGGLRPARDPPRRLDHPRSPALAERLGQGSFPAAVRRAPARARDGCRAPRHRLALARGPPLRVIFGCTAWPSRPARSTDSE
jgi:hypothetical protein